MSDGWFQDPTGRHEHRYWNGANWTEHVATAGIATTDASVPVNSGAVVVAPTQVHPLSEAKHHTKSGLESLALAAQAGDPGSQSLLPDAIEQTRQKLSTRKFRKARNTVLCSVVKVASADDIFTDAEESYLFWILSMLNMDIKELAKVDFQLFEAFVVARINAGKMPTSTPSRFLPANGESVYSTSAVELVKEVTIREYRGGSSGVSVPLGFGVRYRTSSSRGRSVVVGTEFAQEDAGEFVVTSKRSVFVGTKKTLEHRHDKLVSLRQFSDGLQLNVSNRQRTTNLRFDRGSSIAIPAATISHQVALVS